MVPVLDEPVTPNQSRDPVRVMVHAALALYLSPVILIVCLIGGTSILAGGVARIARRVAGKNDRRGDRRPTRIVKTNVGEFNTLRSADRDRERSRIVG